MFAFAYLFEVEKYFSPCLPAGGLCGLWEDV